MQADRQSEWQQTDRVNGRQTDRHARWYFQISSNLSVLFLICTIVCIFIAGLIFKVSLNIFKLICLFFFCVLKAGFFNSLKKTTISVTKMAKQEPEEKPVEQDNYSKRMNNNTAIQTAKPTMMNEDKSYFPFPGIVTSCSFLIIRVGWVA